MEKFKGTKGEWHYINYGGTYIIQDGEFYEDVNILDSDIVGGGIAENNARLIATSPELLDALQDLVLLVDDGDLNKYSTEYAKRIIAKALEL